MTKPCVKFDEVIFKAGLDRMDGIVVFDDFAEYKRIRFRAPDMPLKGLQNCSFSETWCEPKTVRFLGLESQVPGFRFLSI